MYCSFCKKSRADVFKNFRLYGIATLIVAIGVSGGNALASSNKNLPVISGDIALVGTLANPATHTGGAGYGLFDNYSLLGVSGQYEMRGGWKFGYNYMARIGPLNKRDTVRSAGNRTFLGYLSLTNQHLGELRIGRQANLYYSMVDGDLYQSSWFFVPGTSPWHVDNAITYRTPAFNGTTIGLQAFDIAKSSGGHSTTDYGVAIARNFGKFRLSAGYMYFSQYAGGQTFGSNSVSIDQFGRPVNTFGGVVLRSISGVNSAVSLGKVNLYVAIDVRKPLDGIGQNENNIYSYMGTVTYQFATKWKGLIGLYYSSQKTSGLMRGLIGLTPTVGLYYIPTSELFFSIEYQHYSQSANKSCFDGVWCGTEANGQLALGATYSFSTAK
jgi:predicted porin